MLHYDCGKFGNFCYVGISGPGDGNYCFKSRQSAWQFDVTATTSNLCARKAPFKASHLNSFELVALAMIFRYCWNQHQLIVLSEAQKR